MDSKWISWNKKSIRKIRFPSIRNNRSIKWVLVHLRQHLINLEQFKLPEMQTMGQSAILRDRYPYYYSQPYVWNCFISTANPPKTRSSSSWTLSGKARILCSLCTKSRITMIWGVASGIGWSSGWRWGLCWSWE